MQVDGTERLAYVALGARGLAIVDLDGPASVQPIDADRNGVDDRVLGGINTPGVTGQLRVDASRGLAYLTDALHGLATLQLVPPRTKFLTMVRDPVLQVTGDELPILDSAIAYVTDDRLVVTLDALPPPTGELFLVIEEPAEPNRLLAFPNGESVSPLAAGLNTREIRIRGSASAAKRDAILRVVTRAGDIVEARQVHVRTAMPKADLISLRLGPEPMVLSDAVPMLSIGVAGFYADGQVFNLSSPDSGTGYQSSPVQVATIDDAGSVTAGAGGSATIVATNGKITQGLRIRVTACICARRPKGGKVAHYSASARRRDDLSGGGSLL